MDMIFYEGKTMKHLKRTGFIAIAMILSLFAACGGSGNDDGNNSNVTISISPASPVNTRVGESRTLNVTVQEANNTNFELSVIPASGSGCVKNGGNVVCSPTAAGIYEITVTAAVNTSRTATVTLTVGEALPSMPIPPVNWIGIAGNQTTFTDDDIYGITYGDGRFVAVGGNGGIAYSTDGINWTRVTNGTFDDYKIFAVAYGGGMFVAGGQNDRMAYSTDGANWTRVISTFDAADIRGIAYGDGMFVAVGYTGRIAYSTDGINWTRATETPIGENQFYGIAYGGGTFVAVGENGSVSYSTNGTNWTRVPDPQNPLFTDSIFDTNIRGVAYGYGDGIVIAVGDEGKWASSTDGITWWMYGITVKPWTTEYANSTFNLFDEDTVYGITYGDGWFVAVGENGKMAYSAGGFWIITPGNPFNRPFGEDDIYGVAYGDGRFIAVGKSGKMAYSDNILTGT